MMVASIVTARAFMRRENAISQSVQVLGFIRLGLRPTARYGTHKGPRRTIGRFMFCQQPRHSVDGSGVIAFPRRRAINLAPLALCGAEFRGIRRSRGRWLRAPAGRLAAR